MSTPQQQMIMDALSEQEKNEAKSLLRKLLGSKAAAKVLGAGAQSLVAKYITG